MKSTAALAVVCVMSQSCDVGRQISRKSSALIPAVRMNAQLENICSGVVEPRMPRE